MTKYRKLPVVIEARHHANGVVGMVEDLAKWCGGRVVYDSPVAIIIPTLEGEMRAEFGDWIIRGVKGEFYPIKDEIFRETYEVVEADALLDLAWGIIANAGWDGNDKTEGWQEAAVAWRDRYHAYLGGEGLMAYPVVNIRWETKDGDLYPSWVELTFSNGQTVRFYGGEA